jgi:hypothetical protein
MPDTRLLQGHVEAELVSVGGPYAEGSGHADDLTAVEGGVVDRVDDDLGGRDAEIFSVGFEGGEFS